jgi:putative ABC transport system permease protein
LSFMRQILSRRGLVVEALRIGMVSLLSHKMRTLLTMLGMIFGVAAVIAMLSIGEGARKQALENIRLLGADNIIIERVDFDDIPEEDQELGSPGLRLRDMEAISNLLKGCQISPVLKKDDDMVAGRQRGKFPLLGVVPGYLNQFPGIRVKGRWISDVDEFERSKVCVLGSQAASELFRGGNPIGLNLKVAGQWFKVIGIVKPHEIDSDTSEDMGIRDLNNDVYIPYSTFSNRISHYQNPGKVDMLILTAGEENGVTHAADIARRVLNRRHHGARDVILTVPYDLIRQQQATQRMFNLVMGTIASISLLVGGIGIMNIMLSSVLERTREIGTRRAVGATAQEVLLQFVLESTILSVGGGIIGVVLGIALSLLISGLAGWETAVSFWAVVLSFFVSVSTGLIFGIYPARRAAALNPIDALRYE